MSKAGGLNAASFVEMSQRSNFRNRAVVEKDAHYRLIVTVNPPLIALGKHRGMFEQRTQKTNVVYAISDKPMSAEEWSKRHVTPH